MKKFLTVLTGVVLAIACSPKVVVGPTQTHVDRVAAKFPGYTLAQLQQDQVLYEEKCGSCHAFKSPSLHNETEWKQVVPRMAEMANRNTVRIDTTAQASVLRYLITMGRQD